MSKRRASLGFALLYIICGFAPSATRWALRTFPPLYTRHPACSLSKRARRLHTLWALCNLLVPNCRKLFRHYQLTFTISALFLLLSAYFAQHVESRKQRNKPPPLEVNTFQRRQEFCEVVDQFLLRLAIKTGHENRIISGDCACYGRHMADIYISS